MTTQPTAAPAAPQPDALAALARYADYSLLDTLNADPQATSTGEDHHPRQVFSGHYVPVTPTPLPDPVLIAHSPTLFAELGLSDDLARSDAFVRFFSGDLRDAPAALRTHGWATGYALSIYGQEYTQQCPFQTGNGYGDGRALSVLEGLFQGQRWEMQLKGAGRTPYCRGGDGRAVLRSSVREFLAQEHMHALGVPTSRSLSLIASRSEGVRRPWYGEHSRATNPDRWVVDAAAISTRVAPSFLRVGQVELFARRARSAAHPTAMQELEQLLRHAIDREYRPEIPPELPLGAQLVRLLGAFADRLTSLVAHWLRVGYCQGNFNSDNTAIGGFTLDYGPFGFMEVFDPTYQPWTGGGRHFSFFNQPAAAHKNFQMLHRSLKAWSGLSDDERRALDAVDEGFPALIRAKVEATFAAKLGLPEAHHDLTQRLFALMQGTPVDYAILFRELSRLPERLDALQPAFYAAPDLDRAAWGAWLAAWRDALALGPTRTAGQVSAQMKATNPKYTLREWQLVPAYEAATQGDYARIHALQRVMTRPYAEQDTDTEGQFYAPKPASAFGVGGVSHMSCSS